MGKMQALPLATAAQQGIVKIGAGLRVPVAGTVGVVQPLASLWVDASGSDTEGDGSYGNPFATLAKAFSVIVASPLPSGYTVFLPAGDWQEDIGLPPPGTAIVGHGMLRSSLAGAGGATLAWSEGLTNAGAVTVVQLRLVADVTGRDGGDLSLLAFQSSLQGVMSLIGKLVMDGCDGDYANLINCANVSVRNPVSTPSSIFNLTYDPGAGTNGPGAAYNEVSGGLWAGIQYDSMDASVPLYVLGTKVLGGIIAMHNGHVETTGTTAASLSSNDAGSEIAYDGPVDDASPTFHGFGTFRNAELVVKRTVPMNFGSGDVVVAIPPQAVSTLKNVFVMADVAGIAVNWVSSTNSSITLHVTAPVSHPAYELRILVKP